jgi:hypothetical protein
MHVECPKLPLMLGFSKVVRQIFLFASIKSLASNPDGVGRRPTCSQKMQIPNPMKT